MITDIESSTDNSVTQQAAMAYLIRQHHIAPHHAAGLVANADSESGGKFKWDPKVKGDGGKALGLFQWHGDRQVQLFEFAKALTRDVHTRALQLDFALQEIGMLNDWNGVKLPGFMQRGWARHHILATTNAFDAGATVCKYFEGPRDLVEQMRKRGEKADAILKRWNEAQPA